jgi:hypothetical protein
MDQLQEDKETVAVPDKVKKKMKKRKVVDVIYLNDLPIELVVKTLKEKYRGRFPL